MTQNNRETGATKYPAREGADPSDDFSQDAAGNKEPGRRGGLTRPPGDVDDKTHQSDGQNPPRSATPSPDGGGISRRAPPAGAALRRMS